MNLGISCLTAILSTISEKMTTKCSLYGTSPMNMPENFLDREFEWNEITTYDSDFCSNGINIIDSDPIKSELLDLDDMNYASIYKDVQKYESDDASNFGLFGFDCLESDAKPEIRNENCMWSTFGPTLSSSVSSTNSDSLGSAMPLAAVTGNTENITNNSNGLKQQIHQQQTVVVAKTNKVQQQYPNDMTVKAEPNSDDYEQQLQQHNILNNRTKAIQQQSMQYIPPGASLLRKSNAQQQQKKQLLQQKFNPDNISINNTTSMVANKSKGSSKVPPLFVRPDTPHSLDDDATDFKHNVDLRACIIGSNDISLTEDQFINRVSQELQDTSKSKIDLRLSHCCDSIAEVLDILQDESNSSMSSRGTAARFSKPKLTRHHSLQYDSDEESSCDSTSSQLLDGDTSYSSTSPSSSQGSSIHSSNMVTSRHYQHQAPYLHSDHSYTRSKDGINDVEPNLETPSDSDEEIDVVSVGDKKLPTNPSDKDRRALQTKVAYKFSNARIKTTNGLRIIPPRRRTSFDLPYTPASSSPVKSVANSRYPSPASTPYQNQYTSKYVHQQQQQVYAPILNNGNITTSTDNSSNDKPRKRIIGTAAVTLCDIDYTFPPSKKQRGRKSIKPTTSNAIGVLKRHLSLDETDSMDKRNLHNDMERQRRIGLKNLFEALKKQIPNIRDKERAPKVSILREAAKLCENLSHEDQELCEEKAMLKEKLRKNQELLARLRLEQQLE